MINYTAFYDELEKIAAKKRKKSWKRHLGWILPGLAIAGTGIALRRGHRLGKVGDELAEAARGTRRAARDIGDSTSSIIRGNEAVKKILQQSGNTAKDTSRKLDELERLLGKSKKRPSLRVIRGGKSRESGPVK